MAVILVVCEIFSRIELGHFRTLIV